MHRWVPVQKQWALNGPEMEQPMERPFPFRSFFLLHLRANVLQLQLANAAPGFVLVLGGSLPSHNKNNKINKFMVARAMCVMYYGRLVHGTETRLDVVRKQYGNYRSIV